MPDISMCSGDDCPIKDNCYRYIAKPSEYLQAYFSEVPYNNQTNSCEYFWDYQAKKDAYAKGIN